MRKRTISGGGGKTLFFPATGGQAKELGGQLALSLYVKRGPVSKFETFAYCSVQIFHEAVFYHFRCGVLLADEKPPMFAKHPSLIYLCPVSRRHTRSHPEKLLETYDRIPSQRSHATPLIVTRVLK